MPRLLPVLALFACNSGDSQERSSPPQNEAPRIERVALEPAVPSAGLDVSCVVEAIDPDGDSLSSTHVWTVDGEVVSGATSATLPAGAFDAYQQVGCEVSVSDGDASTADGVSAMAEEACGGMGFFGPFYSLETPDAPGLVLGTGAAAFTAETWVYLQEIEGVSRALMWKQEEGSNASSLLVDWGLIVNDQSVLTFATGQTDDGCGYLATDAGAVPLDRWVHVAATYDSDGVTGTKQVFVDGDRVADCSGSLKNAANGGRLLVGGAHYPDVGLSNHTLQGGALDEVRVSTVVRYGPSGFTPDRYHHVDADTVALWHFNRDGATSLIDASGNGHDLGYYEYAELEYAPSFIDFGVSCDGNLPDFGGSTGSTSTGG